MADLTLIIAGNDVMSKGWVAEGGYKHRIEHRSGEDAGETIDGTIRLAYLWTRHRIDVTFIKDLTLTDAVSVLSLASPAGRMDWFDVTFTDLFDGTVKTKRFYANNYDIVVRTSRRDGETYYDSFTLPLIEDIRKN